MKSINALLCLTGVVSGAAIYPAVKPINVEGLANGLYDVPLGPNGMDFSRATLDEAWNISASAPDYLSVIANAEAYNETGITPYCTPQFPTRKTLCRERKIRRDDYLRAYAKYLDWINNGPDNGWVRKHQCKTILWGSVVVSTCSWGGPNPTCVGELVEAMRELDMYCAYDEGGDISIRHWKKVYGRHNVRDEVNGGS
ncbi:uncharacterized protein GGS22DRAFT_184033 [Annulohypoxylon maeteangense]|uniref:uncharacterized protein n=1 Tax=Annulohypoxylon maeteangense TaxID=1927788 RepID=UPI0020081E35|nr:uncharacterized protein GGS22DRAFT_184033 [Annulohypoxylon maeteangense]KAI0890686.1 hypothetical protein GGS22DRAFT_184033 [Annulohypoxylon maeteangense]